MIGFEYSQRFLNKPGKINIKSEPISSVMTGFAKGFSLHLPGPH